MQIVDIKKSDIRLCPDCDLVITLPKMDCRQKACCPRCTHVIECSRPMSLQILFALTLTGLLLYVPATFYPVLFMELAGQQHSSSVWEGVIALWNEKFQLVAILVFFSAMLVPLVRLLVLLPVLLAAHFRIGVWPAKRLYRRYLHLCEWGMAEIYMLGILISLIKLADMASVHVGTGLFCYTALMLVEVAIAVNLNRQHMWQCLDESE